MSKYYWLLLAILLVPLSALAQDSPERGLVGVVGSPILLDRDVAQPQMAIPAGPSAWQYLAGIDEEHRAHASLEIAVPPDMGPEALNAAKAIESDWNGGLYDRALDAFASFSQKADMKRIEMVLQWHQTSPVSLEKVLAGNVQVGQRDTINAMDVVCDSSGRYLFAVVAFIGDTSSAATYELYRSTDKGATWYPTSTNHTGSATPVNVSLAFVGKHVHLAYSIGSGSELRWRKYDTTGTTVPIGSGNYKTLVGPSAPSAVQEFKMFSNNHYFDNRLYYLTLLANHTIDFHWVDADSSSFSLVGSTSGGQKGLSGVWAAQTFGTSIGYVISYIDTANNLRIDTVDYFSGWGHKYSQANAGSVTSLAYYKDTIVCAYEYMFSSNLICGYMISYNSGHSWNSGSADDKSVTHEIPAICMEKGQGMAMIYRFYTSPNREGRIITRQYKGPGAWSTPAKFADYEPMYYRMAITALGGDKWGIIYATWDQPRKAYFAVYQAPLTSVETPVTSVPEIFTLNQNYPNPFNPSTEISYVVPATSNVRLAVFNLLGQEVAELVNGVQTLGVKTARWNAAGMASGVYIYRLQAGSLSAARKMVLVR